MPLPDNAIDRAAWSRMSSGKGGCAVPGCTHSPIVAISVTASERTGKVGGSQLAKNTLTFCATHSEQRYAAADAALRGLGMPRPTS